ncbi:hypothetical protein [Synechococcus sp. MEDNS5]|uniref:hypothetical protein n=1 Tax=Synechococcus sp. MEDNS5 TaxID=1442554 RepID=UPI001646FD8B|nr:hypothetical protein [Synechococcus sp. MEDNS5]
MKLFSSIAAVSIAASALFGLSTLEAKADYAYCNSYGGMTNCYGSDGSSYSSYGIGDNYESYSGTDSNGDYYSGSCTRIGTYVSCNTY